MAVYAHYDWYGIELRLNDHRNKCAVYLEPEVLQVLTEFYKRCSRLKNRQEPLRFFRNFKNHNMY